MIVEPLKKKWRVILWAWQWNDSSFRSSSSWDMIDAWTGDATIMGGAYGHLWSYLQLISEGFDSSQREWVVDELKSRKIIMVARITKWRIAEKMQQWKKSQRKNEGLFEALIPIQWMKWIVFLCIGWVL